jgi:hypothetical protein
MQSAFLHCTNAGENRSTSNAIFMGVFSPVDVRETSWLVASRRRAVQGGGESNVRRGRAGYSPWNF